MGRWKWRQLGTIGTWDEHDHGEAACPAEEAAKPSGLQDSSRPPQDFEPRRDRQCYFCDDPLDSSTRIASDSEDDSGSVASEGEAGGACTLRNMTTLEAVTSMAASLAAVAAFKSSQGSNSTATSTAGAGPQAAQGLYPLGSLANLPAWYNHVAAVAAAAQHQQQQDSSRSTPLDSHSLAGSPGPGSGPNHSPGAGPSPSTSTTPAFPPSASSPGTLSPGGACGAGGASPVDMPMPLDLSAKAAAIALAMERDALRDLRVPDSKNIFKARPRANTALTQRRTYTEDELQAALRDIQSGKLGTRRAAVIYGIPRSTLRNKVYKLTMERKCDPASLVMAAADPTRLALSALALPPEDDDGALSPGEDELGDKGIKSDSPAALAPESLRLLLQHGMRRKACSEGSEEGASPPPSGLPPAFPGAEQWGLPGLDYAALAPYITKLLGAHQSLLTRNTPGPGPGLGPTTPGGSGGDSPGVDADFLPKFPPPLLPDFLFRMMTEDRAQGPFHNGSGPGEARDGRDGEDKRSTASPSIKSDADDDGRPTSPHVILKIPSFKPTTSKNGGVEGVGSGVTLAAFARCGSGSGGSGGESSQHSEHGAPLTAAPAPSVSPPSTAQQIMANKALAAKFPHLRLGGTPPGSLFDLKRSHFGSPVSHHAMAESVMKSMQHQQQQQQQTAKTSCSSTPSTNTGSGKGTRPKRGKYRNYDRDALNEAVKAVQRGEMSVHRAGSFYGVPHSTLEYKVKERHLMRPRKRDPKPQPPADDKAKTDASQPPNVANVLRLSPGDKMPLAGLPGLGGLPGPAPVGPPGPAPCTSKAKQFAPPPMAAPQNGLKPRFDPPGIPSLYPFPFWTAGFPPHLPALDFSTQAAASFNSNSKQFQMASQMMQRLQDAQDSSRTNAGPPPHPGTTTTSPGPGHNRSPGPRSSPDPVLRPGVGLPPREPSPPRTGPGSTSGAGPGAAALALGLKRSRDADETIDDSSSDNNTFLDGIIRYGLEKGLSRPSKEAVEKMADNALLDSLCRSRLDGRLDGRLDIRMDAARARQRTSSSSEDDEVRRPPLSLLHPNVVHLSPSSDGSEDKNSHHDVSEDAQGIDERLPRPNNSNVKPFHANHSPPQIPQDGGVPGVTVPRPSPVNGLEAAVARSASRAEEDLSGLLKSASACDSKLNSRAASERGGVAGPGEDGAKDSNEDQEREDSRTQDIS